LTEVLQARKKIAQRFSAGLAECLTAEVPTGTEESIEHRLVEIEPMLAEHRRDLFLKCFGSMMLWLAADIAHRRINSRNPDAEGAVPFLPLK
jgi:hypothetical protein